MTSDDAADLFMCSSHHQQQQACIIQEITDDCHQQPHTPPQPAPDEPAAAVAAAADGDAPAGADTCHQQPQQQQLAPDAAEATSSQDTPGQQQQEEQAAAAADPQAQQQLLDDCERLKQEGNAAYSRGDYDEALQLYWQAIDQAPEDAQQRAVYLCNAAACYLKKSMWQLAAEQCTQALAINDTYLKALVRRATALQELDDLERALADAQRVLELDPGNSWASKVVQQLQPEVQQRQEKMKEEMIGKLKDLGNNLLGKFGLSLDNFKAEQDPATGGYSIKFAQ